MPPRSDDPLEWKKSTFSGSGNCVEVAQGAERVFVRDSNNPSGTVLSFSRTEWECFLDGAKALEFDWDA